MHEERPALDGRTREGLRPPDIEGLGQFGLGFRFVHSGVRGGVHDHVWRGFPAGFRDAFEVLQVAAHFAAGGAEGDQFAKRRKAALEFPADLPGFSEQEDFHTVRPA